MERAKSGGLLAVLSLTKAEQDLALTQDGQRSCLMSQSPNAPMPLNGGKPQQASVPGLTDGTPKRPLS